MRTLLSTVTEVASISVSQILTLATGSVELGLVGVLGLALLLIKDPKVGIAYMPLAGFFALSYFIGNRAVFFSAPMFWFGIAFCISQIATYIGSNFK